MVNRILRPSSVFIKSQCTIVKQVRWTKGPSRETSELKVHSRVQDALLSTDYFGEFTLPTCGRQETCKFPYPVVDCQNIAHRKSLQKRLKNERLDVTILCPGKGGSFLFGWTESVLVKVPGFREGRVVAPQQREIRSQWQPVDQARSCPALDAVFLFLPEPFCSLLGKKADTPKMPCFIGCSMLREHLN